MRFRIDRGRNFTTFGFNKRKMHAMLDGAESDIAVNERAKAHLIVAEKD